LSAEGVEGRQQGVAVGGEGDVVDGRASRGQAGDLAGRGEVPEADLAIEAGAGQHLAIPGQGEVADRSLVAGVGGARLAVAGVPENAPPIPAATGQSLAVLREGGRGHDALVPLQRELLRARFQVPDLQLARSAAVRKDTTARGQPLAVRTEGDAVD